MKRGEIWTVSGAKDYGGKPRPAVIIQSEQFPTEESVTICGLTTELNHASLIRVPVEPTSTNGLFESCEVMIDKVTTIPRIKMGRKIGELEADTLELLNQAMVVFLGLTPAG